MNVKVLLMQYIAQRIHSSHVSQLVTQTISSELTEVVQKKNSKYFSMYQLKCGGCSMSNKCNL